MKNIFTHFLVATLSILYVGQLNVSALTMVADPVLYGTVDTDPEPSTTSCVSLTYNMSFGSKDSRTNGEVSDLQFYLQDKGYLTVEPTGNFGNATKRAVQSFQRVNGITPNGVAGPFTRAKIKVLSCGGTVVTLPPTPVTSPTPNNCTFTQYWDGVKCLEQTECAMYMGNNCVASPCASGYVHTENTRNCIVGPVTQYPATPANCTLNQFWDGTACKQVVNCTTIVGGPCDTTPCAPGYVHLEGKRTCVLGSSAGNASGIITIDSPSCAIPVGSNQCGAKISWGVTNPVAGKTEFIIAGGFNYTMYLDSYPSTNFMNGKGENVSTYTLKNNGVTLDTKTVTSKCVAGSSWNGSACAQSATVKPVISSGVFDLSAQSPIVKVFGTNLGSMSKIQYTTNSGTTGYLDKNAGPEKDSVRDFYPDFYLANTSVSVLQVRPATLDATVNNWTTVNVSTSPTTGTPSVKLISPNGGESWVVGNTYTINYSVANSVISSANPALVYVEKNGTMWRICKVDTTAGSCSYTVEQSMLNYFSGATSGFTVKVCAGASCAVNDLSDGTISIKSSTTATPALPTASLTISAAGYGTNVRDITYPVGTANTKNWSSTNGTSYSSVAWRTGSCTNRTNGDATEVWQANTASGVSNGIGNAGDVGCVVHIKYTVTNAAGSVSDQVNVTVTPSTATLTPSGSITLDSEVCTIPVGQVQCGAKISWNVTNPVAGKTEFVIAGGFNYTMNQDSYPSTNFMNGRGENVSTYTLKNNGVTLDTKTVTSKCQTGTSWTGSVCQFVSAPPTASLTISAAGYGTNVRDITYPVGTPNTKNWSSTYGTSYTSYAWRTGSCTNRTNGDATEVWQANTASGVSNGIGNAGDVGCVVHIKFTVANNIGSMTDQINVTVTAAPVSINSMGDVFVNTNAAILSAAKKAVATLSGVTQASAMNCVSLNTNLHRGFETGSVTKLQEFLVEKGFLKEKPSGFFGDLTIAAVKAYQRSLGIKETGMVYDATREAIKQETCGI